jgi:hypothetical protein
MCSIILPLLRLTYMEELGSGPFVNKNVKSQTTVKNTFENIITDQKTG